MRDENRRYHSNNIPKPPAGVIGQTISYGQYHPTNNINRGQFDHVYLAPRSFTGHDRSNEVSVLTDNFNRVNLQTPSYHTSTKPSPSISTQSFDGGVPLNPGMPQAFMHNGQLMYAGGHIPANMAQYNENLTHAYGMYPQFMNPNAFQYQQPMMATHSPMSSGWAPSSRVPSGEVPSLVTPRRDSSSSQEGDIPGTPFTHYTGYGDYHGGVSVVDRSPHSMYNAWGTPSPSQNGYKHQHKASLSPRLQLLCQQDPPIPRAIPAPFSPVKPLDRSLENSHGITNVYIRGLQPETTDDLLHKLAGRFGDIVSSKSIIDHVTGLCKGFGFVKFHSFRDAEDCIRGFHYLGYEASFARESFYSQLKKLQDEANTNLYVSNLPKDMNEHELGAIFEPYKVCSSRILRDNAGNGRGVGFARFETRDVCELIIKNFNNTPVSKPGGEEHLIQIRYADTPDQKHLKQQTTAARQYRSAEYESVTSGRTPYLTPARLPAVGSGTKTMDADFEKYMSQSIGYQRPYGDGNIRDRLSTVSSHLSTPHGSVVNVHLPAAAGISDSSQSRDFANCAQDAISDTETKADDLSDTCSEKVNRGLAFDDSSEKSSDLIDLEYCDTILPTGAVLVSASADDLLSLTECHSATSFSVSIDLDYEDS